MTTATLTNAAGQSTETRSGRHQRPDLYDAYRALWAMTRDERIAAMWRGELTTRQLCQWSSRAQHEVPLLGGEFAWIAMRTPEWAEITKRGRRKSGRPVTITLSVIGSRGVTVTVGPSALPEAPSGVAVELALYDGPLVLTLSRNEAEAIAAEMYGSSPRRWR